MQIFVREGEPLTPRDACYGVTHGEPVWKYRHATRFWDSHAGPGPRATPALEAGRVYAFTATGILNVLAAEDGTLVWSHDVASDTGKKVPRWGFSSSPLVVDDIVLVAASGTLVAYDLITGEPRWFGPDRGASYSSPHLMTLNGVAQILLLTSEGAASVALADGTLLWQHAWPGHPIVQPALTATGDVLVSIDSASGLRRLTVVHGTDGWAVEERWTSMELKPYFNDFIVHDGHAYGFDGSILSCIDLEDGARKWKGGRYGNGQLLLLSDQGLLLVLSEKGGLALIAATPDRHTEIARFPALEGKTWNHPVVVAGDILLVRNSQEMAAFRLPLARGSSHLPSGAVSSSRLVRGDFGLSRSSAVRSDSIVSGMISFSMQSMVTRACTTSVPTAPVSLPRPSRASTSKSMSFCPMIPTVPSPTPCRKGRWLLCLPIPVSSGSASCIEWSCSCNKPPRRESSSPSCGAEPGFSGSSPRNEARAILGANLAANVQGPLVYEVADGTPSAEIEQGRHLHLR